MLENLIWSARCTIVSKWGWVTYAGLVAAVDDVVVHRPGGLGRGADGDVLLIGELEQIGTASVWRSVWLGKARASGYERESVVEFGHAPGSDNLEGGVAGLPCELEANLTKKTVSIRRRQHCRRCRRTHSVYVNNKNCHR